MGHTEDIGTADEFTRVPEGDRGCHRLCVETERDEEDPCADDPVERQK